MPDSSPGLQVVLEFPASPPSVFETLVDELRLGLADMGVGFTAELDGPVTFDGEQRGRVSAWTPGARFALEWQPTDWNPQASASLSLDIEPAPAGSRVTFRLEGLQDAIEDPYELLGWYTGQAVGGLVGLLTPELLGDWLTDRAARRPSGKHARETYKLPLSHIPNFLAILKVLELNAEDSLLEVGCGGGAFLKLALQSGCQAAAIDHSPDMVALTQQVNRGAVSEGRLEVRLGDAELLPFGDAAFSCAVMTSVLGFLPEPVRVMAEIRRTLKPGGRFVCLGSDPVWRGTPAAPEPVASRLDFYLDHELRQLGLQAGFERAEVIRMDLEPLARRARLPDDVTADFSGRDAPFLVATKALR